MTDAIDRTTPPVSAATFDRQFAVDARAGALPIAAPSVPPVTDTGWVTAAVRAMVEPSAARHPSGQPAPRPMPIGTVARLPGAVPPPRREEVRVRLELLGQELAVCRLEFDSPVPAWVAGEITSLTRRRGELSIVCAAEAVPDEVEHEGPFRALVVAGRLPFDEVGILHALTAPLADGGVPILALGTYETDVVLVPADRVDDAVAALTGADHEVVDA